MLAREMLKLSLIFQVWQFDLVGRLRSVKHYFFIDKVHFLLILWPEHLSVAVILNL